MKELQIKPPIFTTHNDVDAVIDKPNQKPWERDMVNHPPHYISDKGIETIDVIQAFTEGLDGIEAVCTGNVIKYICRWHKKNGIEDLEKAKWYLNRLMTVVSEKKENE